MKPTMTFTWFLVEYPGISMVSSPTRPMKSQECVVCSFLFGIWEHRDHSRHLCQSPNRNIIFLVPAKIIQNKSRRNSITLQQRRSVQPLALSHTSNFRSLLIGYLRRKASETMPVAIQMRCLCFLHSVKQHRHMLEYTYKKEAQHDFQQQYNRLHRREQRTEQLIAPQDPGSRHKTDLPLCTEASIWWSRHTDSSGSSFLALPMYTTYTWNRSKNHREPTNEYLQESGKTD